MKTRAKSKGPLEIQSAPVTSDQPAWAIPPRSPSETELKRYFDKKGVAAQFGISPRTVDVWMAKKLIPYFKIGKSVFFDAPDIHEHLRKSCRVGQAA